MDIFSLFSLCGGLAFFLFGMTVMSKSLEKMAGGKLERLLKRMTSNRVKALLLGTGITVAIQSSSAVTVMLVGLVNSGVMELGQTIGVIMGSNIGTTTTAWILSLTGIESDNVFLNLLKPKNFSPLLALIGIILIMASKKQKRRDIGRILMGFAILMYGMDIMSAAVEPLSEVPAFINAFTAFTNPLLGVLVGLGFTAVIQSSSASVGILQALALTGAVSYGAAIPIIMGQNIGTCVTALISSIGVSRSAKRVAVVHISFNIIGTAVCTVLFYGANAIFHFPFLDTPIGVVGIAFCHSVFNLFTTALLLPFAPRLEKLACALVKSDSKTASFAFLDPRLLRTPSVAVSECGSMTRKMAALAHENLRLSIQQLSAYDEKREEEVLGNEDKLDLYEDKLGNYLVEISRHNISSADSREAAKLLHSIGDFERIGDHALNIQESARELYDKELHFSDAGQAEMEVLLQALDEILDKAFTAFDKSDEALAVEVEPLEETIDRLTEEMRLRHIERLQSGKCTIQMGFILNDLLTNIERVSDHCSNIAVCVIEARHSQLDPHSYLHDVKEDGAFSANLRSDLRKYHLPRN